MQCTVVSANSYIFQIIILLNIKLTDGLQTVCFLLGENSVVTIQVKDFDCDMSFWGNLSAEESLLFSAKEIYHITISKGQSVIPPRS